ncbi:CDP-glucose 4,6-dehydratase [Prochlorococcus sp. AH-716-E13]|nr:CDP-glucose 4,6-dehydratase [Prochlorococcus sp. AH-716-E13]
MNQNKKLFWNIFENKKVVITGHTGFKGSWLSIWLYSLGAKVYGISESVLTDPSNFSACKLSDKLTDHRADICDIEEIKKIIREIKPDFIFHLAAQSLVRVAYENPLLTWQTNTLGTISILESLKSIPNECISIFVTSDKCYENLEWEWGYRENDRIGGIDPYSASKGGAEIAINSYSKCFFNNGGVKVGIGRAGNVIGGGDWSPYRLVPDCMKSWSKNKEVIIRNPNSTRPWQHVLEPLSGYLLLASRLYFQQELRGEAFNFGPSANQNYNVMTVVKEMSKHWDKVKWKTKTVSSFRESGLLKLNCDKAHSKISWEPVWDFNETIYQTVNWYKNFYENQDDVFKTTLNQITDYTNTAILKNLSWTNAK